MMRALPIVVAGALLVACAPATRVVLLPQPSGPGAVEVRSKTDQTVLSGAYATAEVQRDGAMQDGQTDAAQVRARYGQLLDVQPPPAQGFTLYFEAGGAQLTPASEVALDALLRHASERPGSEILITGHTDRVGSLEANDALSLRRAQAIRELVIARGFDARRVEAVGRGEREPAVPTDDEVTEPRNRRTEIIVR